MGTRRVKPLPLVGPGFSDLATKHPLCGFHREKTLPGPVGDPDRSRSTFQRYGDAAAAGLRDDVVQPSQPGPRCLATSEAMGESRRSLFITVVQLWVLGEDFGGWGQWGG